MAALGVLDPTGHYWMAAGGEGGGGSMLPVTGQLVLTHDRSKEAYWCIVLQWNLPNQDFCINRACAFWFILPPKNMEASVLRTKQSQAVLIREVLLTSKLRKPLYLRTNPVLLAVLV